MCLNPITIVNPSKYVSLRYRDRFLLQVPCGHCAQCQQQKSNEWYYRTHYQLLETLSAGGFCLFDTLTYSNKYLPHVSDFIPSVETDYPCFNSQHLRNFVARLRQHCKRSYHSNFTYFIASEYGTGHGKRQTTHRPHYHCLFFVTGEISPLQFSQLVAKDWYYGRTDGIPWKSATYVVRNCFSADNYANALRTCRYVSKYVQKSCLFQSEIDRRIDSVMSRIADDMSVADYDNENWIDTVEAARYRQKLKRLCNQFHRQSTQFGAAALRDIDLNQLFKNGTLFMPDSKNVVLPIGLPTYYKRKLFYEQKKVDGCLLWTPTDLGRDYLRHRDVVAHQRLTDQFTAAKLQYHLDVNLSQLADYVLDYRGRIKAKNPSSTLEERLSHVDFFNYVTPTDRQQFGHVGVVSCFLGNQSIGYSTVNLGSHYKTSHFARNFCYYDQDLERDLSLIYGKLQDINEGRQSAYRLKQHLTNVYHGLFSS